MSLTKAECFKFAQDYGYSTNMRSRTTWPWTLTGVGVRYGANYPGAPTYGQCIMASGLVYMVNDGNSDYKMTSATPCSAAYPCVCKKYGATPATPRALCKTDAAAVASSGVTGGAAASSFYCDCSSSRVKVRFSDQRRRRRYYQYIRSVDNPPRYTCQPATMSPTGYPTNFPTPYPTPLPPGWTYSPTPMPTPLPTRAPTPVVARRRSYYALRRRSYYNNRRRAPYTRSPTPFNVPTGQRTSTMSYNQASSQAGALSGASVSPVGVSTGACSSPSKPIEGETGGIVGIAIGVAFTLALLLLAPYAATKRGLGAKLGGAGAISDAWRPALFMSLSCMVYSNTVMAWGYANQDRDVTADERFWALTASFALQGLSGLIGFGYATASLVLAKRAKALGQGPKPALLLFASVALYMLSQTIVAWTASTQLGLKPYTGCSNTCAERTITLSAERTTCTDIYSSCLTKRTDQQDTCMKHMRGVSQAGGAFSGLLALLAFLCAGIGMLMRLGYKDLSHLPKAAAAITNLAPSPALTNATLAVKMAILVCAIVGLAGNQLWYGSGTSAVSLDLTKQCLGTNCATDTSMLPDDFKVALSTTVLAFVTSLGITVAHLVSRAKKKGITHKRYGRATAFTTVFFAVSIAMVTKHVFSYSSDVQRVMQFGTGFVFNVIGLLLSLAHTVVSLKFIKADGAAGTAAPNAQKMLLPSPLVAVGFAWSAFMLDVGCANIFMGQTSFAEADCTWKSTLARKDCDPTDTATYSACITAASAGVADCQFEARSFPLSAYKATHLVPGILELVCAAILALVVLSGLVGFIAKRTRSATGNGENRNFIWYGRMGSICLAVWARAQQSLSMGGMSTDLDSISGWVCALFLFAFATATAGSAYVSGVAFTSCISGDKATAKVAFWAPWNLANCALGCLFYAMAVQSGYTAEVVGYQGSSPPTFQGAAIVMGLAGIAGTFFATLAALVPDVNPVPAIKFPSASALCAVPVPEQQAKAGALEDTELADINNPMGLASPGASKKATPSAPPAASGGAKETKFCNNCGAKQPMAAKFCNSCGGGMEAIDTDAL